MFSPGPGGAADGPTQPAVGGALLQRAGQFHQAPAVSAVGTAAGHRAGTAGHLHPATAAGAGSVAGRRRGASALESRPRWLYQPRRVHSTGGAEPADFRHPAPGADAKLPVAAATVIAAAGFSSVGEPVGAGHQRPPPAALHRILHYGIT